MTDNGFGINKDDAVLLAQRGTTSKLTNFSDLETCATLGFRGEALHSICAVSKNVDVTTSTSKADICGTTYYFSTNGTMERTKATPFNGPGTSVCVTGIFHAMPVRKKQFDVSNRSNTRVSELTKIQDIIFAYAVVFPALKISLSHDRLPLLNISKPVCLNSVAALGHIMKISDSNMFLTNTAMNAVSQQVTLVVPTSSAGDRCLRTTSDRLFIFVNKRVVHHKNITKLFKVNDRWPIGLVDIQCPLGTPLYILFM